MLSRLLKFFFSGPKPKPTWGNQILVWLVVLVLFSLVS